MFDKTTLLAYQNAQKIDTQFSDRGPRLIERCYQTGLPPADCIKEPGISTFARTQMAPTFCCYETFLKCDRCEDIHDVGKYDVAFVGIPYDSGTSHRSGTRLGPEGIRRASLGFSPYNPDYGVDINEKLKFCDAGDIYTIPANAEKTFAQITKGIGYIKSQGVIPIIMGGDHSTTFPSLRGIAPYIDGNIGVIHIDRHGDCQSSQMDEKMHGTEWYYATQTIPNVHAENLVQVGVGGLWVKEWSQFSRDKGSTMISMEDIDRLGIEKVAEIALETAWKGCKAVYVSLDIDVLDAAFCPGTGTPDFGGMLPRELLRLLRLVTKEGICGMDLVEVSPPFDHSEITSIAACRCLINVLCNLVLNDKVRHS
ncbi:MAG TPA: agmatinase [Candidatus Cottocaccamicrobium excrementipullorum]|nr:agmatinase [Candidatus Cottocaccamicrobium excrementipullorum]